MTFVCQCAFKHLFIHSKVMAGGVCDSTSTFMKRLVCSSSGERPFGSGATDAIDMAEECKSARSCSVGGASWGTNILARGWVSCCSSLPSAGRHTGWLRPKPIAWTYPHRLPTAVFLLQSAFFVCIFADRYRTRMKWTGRVLSHLFYGKTSLWHPLRL